MKFLKKFAKNKRGSEIVQMIFTVIISLVAGAAVSTWVYNVIADKANEVDGDHFTTPDGEGSNVGGGTSTEPSLP